ncbi:MAG: hypothetical protein FRC54_11060 [bacterium LCO1.1]|uniref:Uncharacterized protein n=1 Tax=Candidatus Weimeria bifida TaxID=2599074 RepID=A0A6N7J187_9FIRM|nr:hypothetical protein [Candidatus Weimeria bifida]
MFQWYAQGRLPALPLLWREEADGARVPILPFGLIGTMRAGTEKIETEVQRLFPKSRILRMDADTTKTPDGYRQIISAFRKDADILIGTQMIGRDTISRASH